MIDLNERFNNDFGSEEKLNEYLELTSYQNNLDLNNLKFNFNSLLPIEESAVVNKKNSFFSNGYIFQYNGFDYPIGRTSSIIDGFDGNDDNDYYLFSLINYPYITNYKLLASIKTNKVVVLPFFGHPSFFEKLNIFTCRRLKDELTENGSREIFYFDIHGRFIKKDTDPKNFPNVAMIDNEIIPFIFDKNLYNVEKIHSYFLIEIFKYYLEVQELYGLIDNYGKLYSEDYYDRIIVSKAIDKAILQKETNTYILDIKSRLITPLPFNYLLKHNDNFIKVMTVSKKYGVIDFNGNEIIKPIFNYIDFNFTEDRFKICNTPYKWIKNEQLEDEFEQIKEYIPKPYGRTGYVEGKLLNSKWGIIKSDLKIIIPSIYNWIEEYDENTYLVNEAGNIYKYTSWDIEALEDRDKEVTIHSQIMVVGGKWYKIDKQGKNKIRFEVEKGEFIYTAEVLERLKKLPIDFYKLTDKKALKI